MSLYFLWVALTDAPTFHFDSRLGYLGALLFGFGAISTARIARHPETYKSPSVVSNVFGALEAAAYIAAAVAGLVWLVERLRGNAAPADDVQRGGLWVLGILAVLVVLRVLGVVGPDGKKEQD